ncbi:U-box domain-containing protein 56 [Clostridium sp. chh4-2]|uniref:U-box domain-containing protein 56 n=1 Tax=Clostridium sp. chh4-2 TaxID=2067550 RepID=UPI000CCE77C3|nr:U-box domain-containing protein 56 [Clostridium sp. chh4-2]PNV61079.1 U-box domain-containing protein 56 [Clostridium sp. chh4-2]
MNEELYELLETEFLKYRIDEEVEDVLLTLAESLADTAKIGQETSYSEQIGSARLTVYGTLEESEDEDPAVFIRSLKINDSEYEINDYLL